MKKLYLLPVEETNNGQLEDAEIFRDEGGDSGGQREKRNEEAGGGRKQGGTGRSQGLGSGKGRPARVTWSGSHVSGVAALRRAPEFSALAQCLVPGGASIQERAWLWAAGLCCCDCPPSSQAAEACALGASLFSSRGEVSALPFPNSLCGPAQRAAAFAPGRPERLESQPSPVPL